MKTLSTGLLMIIVTLSIGLFGCGKSETKSDVKEETKKEVNETADCEGDCTDHDHKAEKGPHGGFIVKVGDGSSFLEVIHHPGDQMVQVFLLGADGKSPVKPDKTISFNVKTEDGPASLEAKALEVVGGYEGVHAGFGEHLLVGQALVTLNGKEYIVILPEHCHEH